MRLFGAASFGAAALALPLAMGTVPAKAQGNDVLGQVQRFFNNGRNDQDAYQRGREDELRRQQAQRDRWRENHDRYGYNDRQYRGDRDYYDNRYSENGQRYPGTYNYGYNR